MLNDLHLAFTFDGLLPPGTWRYACMAMAIVVLGISKTGFGGGIGILSIPLLALVMPAEQMLAVLAVLLVAVDLVANVHYLGEYDWPVLRWLLPGAVLGVGLGCVILVVMQAQAANQEAFNRHLTLTIGLICLAIVVAQAVRLFGGDLKTLRPGPASSVAVGTVAGTVSTVSHSAGPIVTLYLLQGRIDKRQLVGTMLLYTLLINAVKLAAFVAIGTVTLGTVKQTLWMLPLLPIGTLIGVWMNRRMPAKPFAVVMYVAAAAAAVQMIYKALG